MDVEALRHMFTTVPVDVVAGVLFATAVTIDTLRSGANKAIALALSLSLMPLLYSALKSAAFLGAPVQSLSNPYIQTGIFVCMTLALAYILYRMTSSIGGQSGRPVSAILTGIATTFVVYVIWQISPELQTLWHFNPVVQHIFGEAYRFYILLFVFVSLAFVRS